MMAQLTIFDMPLGAHPAAQVGKPAGELGGSGLTDSTTTPGGRLDARTGQEYEAPGERLATAHRFIAANPSHFRADFAEWLGDNWHVYVEFEHRALMLFNNGRSHYGARSIWETMRYDSAIGELKGEFKLNDHRPPCAARLFMLLNPRCEGFFETRAGAGAVRAA